MKTYAESQGEKPFDWNKALKGLRSGYPAKNQDELKKLSVNWVTCACGNLCDAIPRTGHDYLFVGMPVDNTLHLTGQKWALEALLKSMFPKKRKT